MGKNGKATSLDKNTSKYSLLGIIEMKKKSHGCEEIEEERLVIDIEKLAQSGVACIVDKDCKSKFFEASYKMKLKPKSGN